MTKEAALLVARLGRIRSEFMGLSASDPRVLAALAAIEIISQCLVSNTPFPEYLSEGKKSS